MNVKLYGFSITPGNVQLAELFSYLKSFNGDVQTYRKLERISYLYETPVDWVGLILTARDHKKFCELEKDQNGLRVKVSSINNANRLVDFNFFAVRKATGCGIYQHYPNSLGLGVFGYFLGDHNDKLTKQKRKDSMDSVLGQPDEQRLRRVYAKKYAKKRLKCAALLKPEDFKTLVDEMSKIVSLSFDFVTLSAKEPFLRRAQGDVSREHHSIRFAKAGLLANIQAVAKEAVSQKDLDRIAVSGLDGLGDAVTYHLGKNLDTFGKLDFDSIAEEEALNVNNVLSSPIALDIIDAMDSNPKYFSKVAKK